MRLELLYILRNRTPAFRLIANDGLDGGPKVYPDFFDKMAHANCHAKASGGEFSIVIDSY